MANEPAAEVAPPAPPDVPPDDLDVAVDATSPGLTPAHSARPLAGLLSVSSLTVVSRVLGLLRDAGMAAAFGNGPVLDAFSVAFRLPNVTRRLFGEAAFATAFLPVFVREWQDAGEQAAWKLVTAILVVTAAAVSLVTLLAEGVLLLLWSTTSSEETRLLAGLTAALFPYQIFVCLAAQSAAVLHARSRFTLAALLPIVGNALWLAILWGSLAAWSSDVARIYAVSLGVVAVGAVQFLLTIPALRRLGFRATWDWRASRPKVKAVALAVLPVLAGLSVTELNSLADGLFAWLLTAPADSVGANAWRYPLAPGTAAALYLGQRLYQFPLGVFGVALGTVLFPRFARHAAAGRNDELRDDLTLGLNLSVLIGLPASVGLVVVARPLTDALFRYGSFDAADARQTAAAIVGYAVGVWAFIAILIVNRAFYALDDRRTSLSAGMLAALVNVALNLALAWPLGGFGLALATSLAAVVQLTVMLVRLRRRLPALPVRTVGMTLFKSAVASLGMAAACVCCQSLLPDLPGAWGRAAALGLPVAVGVAAYLAAAHFLGLRDLWLLVPRRRT